MLVYGIAVDDDVFHNSGQLTVSTRLQPLADAPVVKIALCQPLVFKQQRYQLMHVVCHQISVRVNDEALVSEERRRGARVHDGLLLGRRRDVNGHFLAKEPLLHFIVAPAAHRVDSRQTLHDGLHLLRQFVHSGQTSLVFLAHHDALVSTHRVLA